MNDTDSELNLLETLYSSQRGQGSPSQRDLAGTSGLSLGMTNALLRRFAERGWVKFSHLTGRTLGYALTPEGITEISRRAVAYFTRAARNASLYRARVDAFVRAMAARGVGTVVLLGPEELDFLFDYSCQRQGLAFVKNPDEAKCRDLASAGNAVFVSAGRDDAPGDAGGAKDAGHAAGVKSIPESPRGTGAPVYSFAEILSDPLPAPDDRPGANAGIGKPAG